MPVKEVWLTSEELCNLAKNHPDDLIFYIDFGVEHSSEKWKEAEDRAYDFAQFIDKITDRKGTIWVIVRNDSKVRTSYVRSDYKRKSRMRKIVSFMEDPVYRYYVRIPIELLTEIKPRLVKRILKLALRHGFELYTWNPYTESCVHLFPGTDWSVD